MIEYVVVYDGDPRMDGTFERCQLGCFSTLNQAQAAANLVAYRSKRAPKRNLRVESREVSPWFIVWRPSLEPVTDE